MKALVMGFKRKEWSKKGTKANIELWIPHENPMEAVLEYRDLLKEREDLILFVFSSLDQS